MKIKHSDISLKELAAKSCQQILKLLETSKSTGLSNNQVLERQATYGNNQINLSKKPNLLQIALSQFKNAISWLLLGAALISLLFSDLAEMYAILTVVVINALIGGVTEYKALVSMDALRKISTSSTVVIRDGDTQTISSIDLVPGDIVLVNEGDLVSSDMCLIENIECQADESLLTGESLPVSKKAHQPISSGEDDKVSLQSFLYKGTAINRGHGTAVVIATGAHTELGKINALINKAEPKRSHLEKRINDLSGQLIKFCLLLIFLIVIIGYFRAESFILLVKTGIALAVAAIPEGLLIVTTLALAKSMLKMAKQQVLIERLSAVETLGATTLIMTDKTGTITENKMVATDILLNIEQNYTLKQHQQQLLNTSNFAQLCLHACLCNNANIKNQKSHGDPIEVALLIMCKQYQPKLYKEYDSFQRVKEIPFSPDIRMMATVVLNEDQKSYLYSIKGAPESVIKNCSTQLIQNQAQPLTEHERKRWLVNVDKLAQQGLRVLAFATKKSAISNEDCYGNLELLGVVAMQDPLRADVPTAIESCKNAGIKIKMVTGDNGLTAAHIGSKINLINEHKSESILTGRQLKEMDLSMNRAKLEPVSIFSRVSPSQKYQLAEYYQSQGHIVAMTGDGVNDAPALKKADIGIAMGIRGTQVARQASDMVLLNDAFTSIVKAIAEGRTIFNNIRKFVLFLLSCNISELLVVSIAVFAGLPVPLLPLQILFLNLVTDVFPALALGSCDSSKNLLHQAPRDPKESIIESRHWLQVILYACVISLITLAVYLVCLYYLKLSTAETTTATFLTLAITQLLHVLNMHEVSESLFVNEVSRNKNIWLAIFSCLLIIYLALYVPVLSTVLQLSILQPTLWFLIFGASSLVLTLSTPIKNLARKQMKKIQAEHS